MANARLLEKMCDSLKPKFPLSDNGNLQEKNVWKNAFEKYTNYYRQVADITLKIYYDLFLNNCDVDLQRKLESVKGLKTIGEKSIWEEVLTNRVKQRLCVSYYLTLVPLLENISKVEIPDLLKVKICN